MNRIGWLNVGDGQINLSFGTDRRIGPARWAWLIVLVGLAGCGPSGDSETDKKEKYQVEQSIVAPSSDPKMTQPNKLDQAVGVSVENDVDKLIAISQSLVMRARQIPYLKMLADLETQVQIAERILELNATDEQRLFAVQIALKSLLQLVDTADLEARERMISFARRFLEDPNPEIQRSAWVAMTAVRLDDVLRVDDADTSRFDESVAELLERFPNDTNVAKELQMMNIQLMVRNRRDDAIRLMRDMAKTYNDSDQEDIRKIAATLNDRIYMAEIEFDVIARKLKQGDKTKSNEFLDLVRKLAARPEMGEEIYREIIWTERWLEQINRYSEAKQILDMIDENRERYPGQEFRETVKQDVQQSQRRLDLLGQSISFSGQDTAGTKIQTSDLKGNVVALAFWSAEQPNSVQMLQQLVQLYQRFKSRGLEIVSVCIDENVTRSASLFGAQPPPWITLYRNGDGTTQSQLEAAGIQFTPYIILLDRNGVVRDINVSLDKLTTGIERLLSN